MRTTLSGRGCRCTHCEVPRKHRCCHWHSRCALSPTHRFCTALNFHFVPKFSSFCHAAAIHHIVIFAHVLHRRNTSFEVWYLRDAHENDHVDEVKSANILSHGECAQCDDVLTHKKNRTKHTQVFVLMCAMWKSVFVVMSSFVSVS